MAATIRDVKSTSGNFTTQQLAAFASNPVNGDTIVVGYSIFQGPVSQSATAPTDTAGNTYTQIGTYVRNTGSGQPTIVYWASQNVTGGSTFRVTVNPSSSGSVFNACIAWCLTGVKTSSYNGDFKSATGSATTVATGASSPAPSGNSIFIGFCGINSSAVLTNGAGWNTIGSNGFTAGMNTASRVPDFSANMDGFSQYKLSNTVEDCNWTSGDGNNWAAAVASFSELSATGFPGLFFAA